MTLIEVLVALLIFSFGLLGFVGLQARAIQYSVSAENSNRAALLANEMTTAVQLYGSLSNVPPDYKTTWVSRVKNPAVAGLPNATATAVPVGTNAALITITWQRPGTSSTAASASTLDTYQTQVYVP